MAFYSNNRGNNTVTLQLPYDGGHCFKSILTAKSAHSSTYFTVKPDHQNPFRLNFIADSDGGLMAVKNFHLKYGHCPEAIFCIDHTTLTHTVMFYLVNIVQYHHVSNATLTSPVIDKFSGQKCF
ncbi:hypothetical protein DERP_013100 [Dermatophagoides pteronyssinus]|uniref:Uncharacterized protein n=1 Tax=Dermatophagoides pteronyssinus TaxID=6956 RepID=A0ABQ8J632_DERPT|nr:hypothetical protein DERP_013100 [Dermatophagoides pteronyssinus]